MKIEEIRTLTTQDMANRLEAAHEELFNLRFRLAAKQLVNYSEIRRVKKEIARLKTILREKELGTR